MIHQLVLFIYFLRTCNGFYLSPLQNIVATRILLGSLQRSISYEILDNTYFINILEKYSLSLENLFNQQQSSQYYQPSNIIFDFISPSIIIPIILILQLNNHSTIIKDNKIQSLSTIEIKTIEKNIKTFILIIIFVMTKNVYNAI